MSGEASHPNLPDADSTPTYRLVIRARIIPPGSSAPTDIPRRSNRRWIALVLGVAALGAVSWIGMSVLRTAPSSAPAVSETSQPAASTAEPKLAETSSVASATRPADIAAPAVLEKSEASAAVEVLPDVPRSALETIRGTIIVGIRVSIDENGAVLTADAEEPGPSRYFERLALDASRKWTFAPAKAKARRTALVQFYFRRSGATARAEHPR